MAQDPVRWSAGRGGSAAGRFLPSATRYAAVLLVVLATAASVWLWGRPEPPPATVTVVATSEVWPAGQAPVGLELVQAPVVLAPWLVAPQDLQGKVALRDIPAGVLVAAPMIADPAPESGSTTARVLLEAASDWWPYPGPRPGDMAVLAERRGGCALAVLEAVAVQGSGLVVDLDPALASVLGATTLVMWPAPDAGWPPCPTGRQEPAAEDATMREPKSWTLR